MLNNQTNGHKMTTTSAETIIRTETAVLEASTSTSERKNSMSNGSSSSNSLNGDASHEYTTASTASGVATNEKEKTCGSTGKPILNQLNKYLTPPPGVHLKGKYKSQTHM